MQGEHVNKLIGAGDDFREHFANELFMLRVLGHFNGNEQGHMPKLLLFACLYRNVSYIARATIRNQSSDLFGNALPRLVGVVLPEEACITERLMSPALSCRAAGDPKPPATRAVASIRPSIPFLFSLVIAPPICRATVSVKTQ